MSQSGIIDVEGSNPQIPTSFDTDNGTAIPIANVLEILGDTVVANTNPTAVETTGSGNTVTIEVAVTQELAAPDVTKVGLCNFDSTGFDVDADGFVTLTGGGGATTNIDVDASTLPGTDPVVPLAGNIIVTGAQVASGVVGANVIRTNSIAANTVTIEVQRSSASASAMAALNGVAHFDSASFSVDANGFVALLGADEAIDSIGTQTGTNPIVPTVAGLVTINGAVVAAGTNPVRSNGTGANTMAIEVQTSQALASTDATKIGLCNFNSSQFAVDANGFVTLAGGGLAIDSIGVQATSGGGTDPVVATAGGQIEFEGGTVAAGTNPVRAVSTAINTVQIQNQISQALATTDATKIGLCNFNSAEFAVDANGFVDPLLNYKLSFMFGGM